MECIDAVKLKTIEVAIGYIGFLIIERSLRKRGSIDACGLSFHIRVLRRCTSLQYPILLWFAPCNARIWRLSIFLFYGMTSDLSAT